MQQPSEEEQKAIQSILEILIPKDDQEFEELTMQQQNFYNKLSQREREMYHQIKTNIEHVKEIVTKNEKECLKLFEKYSSINMKPLKQTTNGQTIKLKQQSKLQSLELLHFFEAFTFTFGVSLSPVYSSIQKLYSLKKTKFCLTFADFKKIIKELNDQKIFEIQKQERELVLNQENSDKAELMRKQTICLGYQKNGQAEEEEEQRIQSLEVMIFKIASHKYEIQQILNSYAEDKMHSNNQKSSEINKLIKISLLQEIIKRIADKCNFLICKFEDYKAFKEKGIKGQQLDDEAIDKIVQFIYLSKSYLSKYKDQIRRKQTILKGESKNSQQHKTQKKKIRFFDQVYKKSQEYEEQTISIEQFNFIFEKYFTKYKDLVCIETDDEIKNYKEREQRLQKDFGRFQQQLDDFFLSPSEDESKGNKKENDLCKQKINKNTQAQEEKKEKQENTETEIKNYFKQALEMGIQDIFRKYAMQKKYINNKQQISQQQDYKLSYSDFLQFVQDFQIPLEKQQIEKILEQESFLKDFKNDNTYINFEQFDKLITLMSEIIQKNNNSFYNQVLQQLQQDGQSHQNGQTNQSSSKTKQELRQDMLIFLESYNPNQYNQKIQHPENLKQQVLSQEQELIKQLLNNYSSILNNVQPQSQRISQSIEKSNKFLNKIQLKNIKSLKKSQNKKEGKVLIYTPSLKYTQTPQQQQILPLINNKNIKKLEKQNQFENILSVRSSLPGSQMRKFYNSPNLQIDHVDQAKVSTDLTKGISRSSRNIYSIKQKPSIEDYYINNNSTLGIYKKDKFDIKSATNLNSYGDPSNQNYSNQIFKSQQRIKFVKSGNGQSSGTGSDVNDYSPISGRTKIMNKVLSHSNYQNILNKDFLTERTLTTANNYSTTEDKSTKEIQRSKNYQQKVILNIKNDHLVKKGN